MGKECFRIGQIADIHLIGDNDQVDHLNAFESFQHTLIDAKKFDLDLLVISGDMTEHSYQKEYELFFEMMKTYANPWCIIAGNHDKAEDISKYSPFLIELKKGDFFYKKTINGFVFFFLDSSKGMISKSQLDWLEEEAGKELGEVFVFVHHPPCLCGHLFMDSRYALSNWRETKAVFCRIPNLHSIFTGHYHSAMQYEMGKDKTVYLTPATQMQLDPNTFDFKILSTVPGWRYISFDGKKISTEIRYLV